MSTLFVCGDIVNESSNLRFIGDEITKVIQGADYSVCNLEGPELKFGQVSNEPHQEPGTIAYLHSKGFNLMLLANNHITELGAEGVKHTKDMILASGTDCIGAGLSWADAYKPFVKEIDGKRFGFINICEAQVGQFVEKDQSFGYAWMGYHDLFDDVRNLKSVTDYVIVFVHAGLEHYPVPLPEFRDLFKKLCNEGASVVIGGHPHCAQGWEKYNDSVILYSLGNFFFPFRHRWPLEIFSYSVILEFIDTEITVKPIFHRNHGDYVELEGTDSVGLDKLNMMLGESYYSYVDEMIEHVYSRLCKPFIVDSTCGQDESDSFRKIARKLLNYTVYRKEKVLDTKSEREKLLLRLFENETYRWVIIRHLKHIVDRDD